MYQSINEYQFRDAFRSMGRGDQFTYEGLNILFNWLEQYEVDTGERVELDVISLCCDFSEDSEDIIRGSYADMMEDDKDTGGTKNTEFGEDLYFLIEDAIESAIDYQGRK